MTITADFSGGEKTVTTEPLYQWDTGQKLALSGLPQTASDIQVHFANAAMAQAIVKATELVDSLPTCDIPNEFLQFGSAAKARAWVFYKTSNIEGYTVRAALIPITPRKRPNDYVSPEDPDSKGIVDRAIELLENYQSDLDSKLDDSDGAVDTENLADESITVGKVANDLAAVINAKEVKSNKKTTLTGNELSNDFYPTTKAVADFVLPIKNGVSVYKRLDLIKNIGLTSINDLEVKSTFYYATTLSLAVHEGEKYRVTCKARGGAFPALFYALNGATVTSTIRDENLVDEIITVPSGVDTLYLNGSGIYQPAILNFNADVDHTIMNVVNAEYGEAVYSEISPEINNGYKSYQANADRTPSITHQSDSGYHFVELNVEPNEQYEIIAAPIANSDLYGLYDKTNYILSSSNGTAPDTFVTIPSNAYKLIVNAYGDIIIKKRGYRIANDVTNYNNNVVQNNYSSLIVNDNTINGIINSRPKYRYLWHDNFYREDNITDLGQNGDANLPMIYTYAGSQAGISNHCAVNTGSTKAFAYADMHVSDCSLEFQADLSEETYTTRGVGVVARLADASNYYYCMQRTQYIRFGKYVNGEMTELGNIYITSADRAPKKIGLKLCGNKIDVLCNGIIIRTVYDNSLPNGTNHGIVFDGNASGKMVNFGVKHEIEWQQMIDAMDNGTLPYNIQAENRGEPYNFAIQSDVVNGSRTALRFENRKPSAEEIASAANKSLLKRSEIRLTDGRQQLDEQIFSFDMMLAEEYSQLETLSEIIMQMHDTPDSGMENIGFEPAFEIYVKNGDYYIHTEWSEDKQSIIAHSYNTENTNIGSYVNDIGQWVNWKIHFKWAYNDFFEPIIEVYKNGQLVYVSKNPNVVNAVQAPYFKIGIYTFNYVENPDECVSNKRVMYVDNIRAWF